MFHKEGHKIILISFFIVGCLFLLTDLIGNSLVEKILQILNNTSKFEKVG